MDLKHHIGAKVKSARLGKGLTQEQLASAVGKAVETVSNIERGFALSGLDTLQKIGETLGVPMVFFFDGIEETVAMPKGRFEFEERLRALGREAADADLPVVLAVVEAVIHIRR